MDFSIRLSGGQLLKGIISSPGENPRAGVIIIHGLGEYIGRYNQWIKKFLAEGIAVAGVDLPGHGNSDGKRGNIKSYSVTGEMLDILLREFRKTFREIPLFLYGQSLGGGIVLEYILRKSPDIRGAIVTSPWLKLGFEPPKFKLVLAGIMKNIYPSLIQPSGLIPEFISHDNIEVQKYINDPLVHGKISVGLFHSAMEAAAYSLKNASSLTLPVLLMHGTDDKLTSPEGSREFASKTGKVQLRLWEGGYHELHNEPFKDEVFSVISGWINNHI